MPRNTIYTDTPVSSGEYAAVPEVQWSPDQDVQLGVVEIINRGHDETGPWIDQQLVDDFRTAVSTFDGTGGVTMLTPDSAVEAFIDVLGKHDVTWPRRLYTTTVSRRQINELIRTLRRARAAVFGADE